MTVAQIRKTVPTDSRAYFNQLVRKYTVKFPSQPIEFVAQVVADMINGVA